MPNIRVIYNNAADRATLTADTTAGSLAVTNLLSDIKSAVWRATKTSGTITATWTKAEPIGGVILPFCNLSSEALVRVRGYANVNDTTPLFDTGNIQACPSLPLGIG